MKTNLPLNFTADSRHAISRRGALMRTLALATFGHAVPVPEVFAEDKTTGNDSKTMSLNPRLFSFVGGLEGQWKVTASSAIAGDALPAVERLNIVAGNVSLPANHATWVLHGVASNERYVTRPEKEQLLAKQPALGRPEADVAVLIPIRKNAKWWTLTQDERRRIFEEQSHHNQIGLDYLPAVARKLHHCRDLAETEPFDFLTWFEFARQDTVEFDKLLKRLRATEGWKFVEREVEIRLVRDSAPAK